MSRYGRILRGLMLVPPAMLAASGEPQAGMAARGKFLAEEVASCQRCHTRQLASGELDRSAWLKGSQPPGKSSQGAPDITSGGEFWKRWGENGVIQFLVTGRTPDGARADEAMPHYRLRRDDAAAIVAYLKSLK